MKSAIIRRLDELVELVLKGYKSYYHRGVCRWYLRRGDKRILIDRSLDKVAEEIHRVFRVFKEMCREVSRKSISGELLS